MSSSSLQVVPLQPVASQTTTILLGNQNTVLNVYQKSVGLFMDVYIGDTLIIGGVLCLNNDQIVRDAYIGYKGDFFFNDSYGTGEDPSYEGLGTQFVLYYAPVGVTLIT